MAQIDKAAELQALRAKLREFMKTGISMGGDLGFMPGEGEIQEALANIDTMPEAQLRQMAQMADMFAQLTQGGPLPAGLANIPGLAEMMPDMETLAAEVMAKGGPDLLDAEGASADDADADDAEGADAKAEGDAKNAASQKPGVIDAEFD